MEMDWKNLLKKRILEVQHQNCKNIIRINPKTVQQDMLFLFITKISHQTNSRKNMAND